MARTSSTILNESGESRHPCFVPCLRWKAFKCILPLNMMLIVAVLWGEWIDTLYQVEVDHLSS